MLYGCLNHCRNKPSILQVLQQGSSSFCPPFSPCLSFSSSSICLSVCVSYVFPDGTCRVQLSCINLSRYTGRGATAGTLTNRDVDDRSYDPACTRPVCSQSKDADVMDRTRAGAMTVSMSPYVLLSC